MPRDDTNTCTTAQGRARARSAGCPPARVRGGVESLRARDAFVVTPGPAGLKLAHRSKAPWPGWVLVGHGRAAGCCVGRLPERARQSHEGDVGLVGTEGTQHLALGCPRAPRDRAPPAPAARRAAGARHPASVPRSGCARRGRIQISSAGFCTSRRRRPRACCAAALSEVTRRRLARVNRSAGVSAAVAGGPQPRTCRGGPRQIRAKAGLSRRCHSDLNRG
jgi:hypothetical protein